MTLSSLPQPTIDAAVESVRRRGFYDNPLPVVERAPVVMAQFLRLCEELGEAMELWESTQVEQYVRELADAAIVWCQLAHLTGYVHDPRRSPIAYLDLLGPIPPLARALRKLKGDLDFGTLHASLHDVLATILEAVDREDVTMEDFHERILAKLTADEQRGYLHSHVPSNGKG